MIGALILTLIVFVCFWIVQQYCIGNAPFDPKIKWGFTAIAALIAVLLILGIWGILPVDSGVWHARLPN